jgi:hypothetical protein
MGDGGITPLFLNGSEWSASRTRRFTPGERGTGSYCIGGWVEPKAVLQVTEKRKSLFLAGNRIIRL